MQQISAADGEAASVDNFPLELTHNNHFKFGYDGRWFSRRRSSEEKWSVAYGRCTRPVGDWRSECIETARLIRDSTDQDLWVLFSGGIDSEVVLQAFSFARIPCSAAITSFRNDLNRQDVRYAIKFCETHQIPYRKLDIDIEQFVSSGRALDYADRTKCVQPQLLHTMWAMDQVDGYPILGSAECYLVRSAPKLNGSDEAGEPMWEMLEKERIASWYRHLIETERRGCAGFFQYSPEIMLSFLLDETINKLCTNRIEQEHDTMGMKGKIYRNYFLLEHRKKYHGFENVMHLDDQLRPILEDRYGQYNGIVRTAYSDLVAALMP